MTNAQNAPTLTQSGPGIAHDGTACESLPGALVRAAYEAVNDESPNGYARVDALLAAMRAHLPGSVNAGGGTGAAFLLAMCDHIPSDGRLEIPREAESRLRAIAARLAALESAVIEWCAADRVTDEMHPGEAAWERQNVAEDELHRLAAEHASSAVPAGATLPPTVGA